MLSRMRSHLILITVILPMLFGCKDPLTTPGKIPYGNLSSYEGCKTFDATSSLGPGHRSDEQECATYEYDGEGLLVIEHINSGFNCCPGEVTADIFVSGNRITIEEKEAQQGCLCLCLFDVSYELHELEPVVYAIEIKGLYIEDTDEALRFNVDLTGPRSGTICEDRTHYPWSTSN